MYLLFKNAKNTHFLNEISSKNFKYLNGPRFSSCISISSIIKKIYPKISLTTLVLKDIWIFSNSVTCIILSKIYSIYSSFSLFVEFLNMIAKKLYLWLQFLGGLVCFHPYISYDVPYIIDHQHFENLSLESIDINNDELNHMKT